MKKEKVASPATESVDTDKATALPAPTLEPTKKKKGLFAKLTSGKKKRKAEEDISPSGAGAKPSRNVDEAPCGSPGAVSRPSPGRRARRSRPDVES